MLYERKTPVRDSRVVVVKEFRSSVSNQEGYIYELSGGSSWKTSQDSLAVATEECYEEIGVRLTPDRFTAHQTRQVSAPTLTHKTHLFSAELSSAEMDEIAKNTHQVHGIKEESERTWAVVVTYGELLANTNADWSTLGIISSILQD